MKARLCLVASLLLLSGHAMAEDQMGSRSAGAPACGYGAGASSLANEGC